MSPAEELAYLRDLVAQLQDENTRLKQTLSDAGLQKGLPGRAESVCELYVQAC